MAANNDAADGWDNRVPFTNTANGPATPRFDAVSVICWVSVSYCPLKTHLRNVVWFFEVSFIGSPSATNFTFVGPGSPGAGWIGLPSSVPYNVER
jgi:hypothetical protein